MQSGLNGLIFEALKKFHKQFILLFILSVCWASREILTPYCLSYLIDLFSLSESNFEFLSHKISSLFTGIVILWVFMELSMRLQGYIALKTFPLVKMLMREKVLDQIKQFSPSFFSHKMPGEINDRLASISRGISSLLTIFFMCFVPIGSYILFSLIILYTINIQIAFLFSSWVCVHLSITRLMSIRSLKYSEEFSKAKSTLYGKTLEIIENILLVQTHLRQLFEKQNLKIFQTEKIKAEQKSQKYLEKMRLFLGLSSIALLVLTLSFSHQKWKMSLISNGELVFIVTLILNLTGYLWYLSMEIVRFFEELGVVREAALFLSQPKPSTDLLTNSTLKDYSIDVRGLFFAYSTNKPLFQNLQLSIAHKERVAITGISGIGKTTLIHLLLKHYEAHDGEIHLGKNLLNNLSLQTIRDHISVAYQTPLLFNRSIRENVAYSKLDATDEEIYTSCKMAMCHDFIESLPQGYKTLIGDKGKKLSGGQKQRIAIARALLKKSPILILDEPTSSLDAQTEEALMKNLIRTSQDKTLIVITHRPSTLKFFNRTIQLR